MVIVELVGIELFVVLFLGFAANVDIVVIVDLI